MAARVVASEVAADLSLIQLERVPSSAVVARLADSDTVQVDRQVVVVGAPYGLSYSMSVGWISARWPPNTVYKTMPLAEFFQTDATIKTVAKGSPADLMGLRGGTTYATIGGEGIVLGGDVVLTVEGIPAGSAANIRKIRDELGAARPGRNARISE